MPVRQYANAPATTLSASCTAVATTIAVTSVTGLPITYPYTLILDRGLSTEEAVSVTAAAGTTLTVTRGIDSTTAFAHANGASVVHGITAQDLREPNTHINTGTGVHGLAGAVVGTTDAQTLTNKTLTSPILAGTPTGVGITTFVEKTSLESVASSTVLQNDDHLFFTAEANALYAVTIVFAYTSAASGGLKIALSAPGTPTKIFFAHDVLRGTTQGAYTTANAFSLLVTSDAATNYAATAHGYVQTPTAGTVNFQWAQFTSNATATQILAGSHMTVVRVA